MEIERERERVMQEALMKKEAELREMERKRKEEWIKRRHAELMQTKKHEQEGLDTMRHHYQAVMDELTKSELERTTMKVRVEQERQRCAELASGLDNARRQQTSNRGQLVGVASEVKVCHVTLINNLLIALLLLLLLELATRVSKNGISQTTITRPPRRTNDW